MTSPLRVGVDTHVCRTSQTGIYTFVWNLIAKLKTLPSAPAVTMILYGPPIISEPKSVLQMQSNFADVATRYITSGPSPVFKSRRGQKTTSIQRKILARIDRNITLRLWRKLNFASRGPWRLLARTLDKPVPAWWNELDVVHHTAGLLLPLHPRANVLTINDLIPHHFQNQYRSEFEWFGESFQQASKMDAILVYSEHTKNDVIEVLGIEADKIHVVPLAAHKHYVPVLDRAVLSPILDSYGLTDKNFILHSGSLEPRKNLTRLVEAFYELMRQLPQITHQLVFTGPRFSNYQPIFDTIEQLGLQQRVKWLGPVPFDHLPHLMNAAAVFVYPSLFEGFGLPPLEAMACGTPVIASKATSVPEVVGNAAILIDPYRVREMTDAMVRVLTEPGLAEKMSVDGVERAAQFSWNRTASLTLKVYEEAVRFGNERRLERATTAPSFETKGHPSLNQLLATQWLYEQRAKELLEQWDPSTRSTF